MLLNAYLKLIKNNPKKLWFKAKIYGWGWTPVTWQGWVVVFIYILGLMRISDILQQKNSPFFALLFFIAWTALLIAIGYHKGEKPHWSWGNK